MWRTLKHSRLYLLVLFSAFALLITALGGGLFQQGGFWMDHWQHKAFRGICHQDPLRSFWINGTPMAVCTRCFGIYSSFASAWLIFPVVLARMGRIRALGEKLLIAAVVINIVDVLGNAVGLWHNTEVLRFTFGLLLGVSAVVVLGNIFINNNALSG